MWCFIHAERQHKHDRQNEPLTMPLVKTTKLRWNCIITSCYKSTGSPQDDQTLSQATAFSELFSYNLIFIYLSIYLSIYIPFLSQTHKTNLCINITQNIHADIKHNFEEIVPSGISLDKKHTFYIMRGPGGIVDDSVQFIDSRWK